MISPCGLPLYFLGACFWQKDFRRSWLRRAGPWSFWRGPTTRPTTAMVGITAMEVQREGEEIGIIIQTAAMRSGAIIGAPIAPRGQPEGEVLVVDGIRLRHPKGRTPPGGFRAGQDEDLG